MTITANSREIAEIREKASNMKLAVSYTKTGEITVAFAPEQLGGATFTVGYEPADGEHHSVLEVPAHHQGKPLKDFIHLLRVNTSGTHRLENKP